MIATDWDGSLLRKVIRGSACRERKLIAVYGELVLDRSKRSTRYNVDR